MTIQQDSRQKISLQVDITNPGEFFACCGLLELADRLSAGAMGWFEDSRFHIECQDCSDPISVNRIMWSLANVGVEQLSDNSISPLVLGPPFQLRLNWWLRQNEEYANRLKTWAGQQTSAKMFRKWQDRLKEILSEEEMDLEILFQETCSEQGSFGFDSRSGWNALSVGFSLNEHAAYKKMPARPAVEVLGAIGLQRFFPDVVERDSTTLVSYATWNAPLYPAVARLAATGSLPDITSQRLETRITRRGSYKGLDTAVPRRGDLNV